MKSGEIVQEYDRWHFVFVCFLICDVWASMLGMLWDVCVGMMLLEMLVGGIVI